MIGGELSIRKLDKVLATRYIWSEDSGTDELIFTSGDEMIVLSFNLGEFSKIVEAIERHDLHDATVGGDENEL